MVHAPITFHDVHVLTVRIAPTIDPGFVIKANRIDYQCVTVPLTDGVSVPRRVRVLWEFAAIHPDFTVHVIALKIEQDPSRDLDNLKCSAHDAGHTRRITAQNRVISPWGASRPES